MLNISTSAWKYFVFASCYFSTPSSYDLMQCFSDWVSRRDVRDSERRKCVMAEEFYWRS